MTLFQEFNETFKRYRNRPYLIDSETGEVLTFEDVHWTSCALAERLKKDGLAKGDRVAVLMRNSVKTALIYYGCLYAGVVVVPVNPLYSLEEIRYIVRHSGAKIFFFADSESGIAHRVAEGQTIRLVNVSAQEAGTFLSGKISGHEAWRDPPALEDNDTAVIVYTSGTTAAPKGVTHAFGSLYSNARMFNEVLGISEANRFYGILPMTYLGGYYNLLLLPAVSGASVVVAQAFDVKTSFDFWSPAIRYEVNTLWLVPTIAAILLRMDRRQDGEKFCRAKIKLALIGTAPLPKTLRRHFEERYGVILNENYALSETLFITSNAPQFFCGEGSVGRALPGVDVWVEGENGQRASAGIEGEIAVKTPHMMLGYHGQSAVDLKSVYFYGFKTGDLGVMNENHELFVTGRKKDLIIRGGFNISPVAIEDMLQQHEAVEQAIVVGIAHDTLGEEIVAAIKLRRGETAEKALGSLKELCRLKLGPQRQIGHWLVLNEMPLGPTGKVLKRRVREMALEQLNPGTR